MTICRLTEAGRARYIEYLATLEQVVRDAAAMMKEEKPARTIGGLEPSSA